MTTPTKERIAELLGAAWEAREGAYPHKSGTKVGCALLTDQGTVRTGWNIEGFWMTSLHAEVNAIGRLSRNEKIIAIAVVAETAFFTPCGACLDWIEQFATPDCILVIQGKTRKTHQFLLREMMPHYPRQ